MGDESKRLADLIASVADGGAIDWEALEQHVTDEVSRRLLEDLRVVAGIAEVHRSQVADDESTAPIDPKLSSAPLGRWGNFLLLEKIGEGTFSGVYHAHDSWLDHGVALKLLKPHLADPVRLLHEARTLVKVRHANVVEVYGADLHDGRVGFWMELIRGQTLAQAVAREGVRSASEAAIMGQDLCRALAAVHATGIVHRDIKAQNVMRQSGTGRLVLMDFGAGELMTEPRAARGQLRGTPLYLAPELFERQPATVQTDIYALGVLLYYLTTGDFPVRGSDLDDLERAHGRGERRHLGDARPDLPDAFVRVVDRMLARDPADRYSTAASARLALEGVVAPAAAATQVPSPRAARQAPHHAAGRRALVWGAAALVAVATVTALGLASTAAFNLTFGRGGGFGAESPFQWFVWGLRSLLSPVVRIGLAAAALTLVVGLVRLLCRLVPPLGAAVARGRRLCVTFARERQLDDPDLLIQVVAGCGALAFAALAWIYWDSVSAFAIFVNDAAPEQLAALQPANEWRFDRYARVFELLLFLYGGAAYLVYRSARLSRTALHPAALASAIAVPALALLLLRGLPYRIVYQNTFERVDLGPSRCYQIGTRPGEVLLHCPDAALPRNQAVSDTDPRLRRRGVVESVFTPGDESQATR